jgi:hypothetical protein
LIKALLKLRSLLVHLRLSGSRCVWIRRLWGFHD